MTDFKQAVEWMKEGKKVRRSFWSDKTWFIRSKDNNILDNNGLQRHYNIESIEATDWEIYQEEDNWSPIIYHIKYESKHDDRDRNYYEEEDNFITEEDFRKLYIKLQTDFAKLSVDLGYGNRMLQPLCDILRKRFNKK
jgi:hypothetical protein